MTQASLSHAECNAIHILREMANDATRKQVKREIFARAKSAFGIPPTHKLVVETDVSNANAGVLRNKATREAYELAPASGKWIHANGANPAAKRWFKLPAANLHEAVLDALEAMDANGDSIQAGDAMPNAVKIVDPGTHQVVVDQHGNAWVELEADAFNLDSLIESHDEEEDDDHPY